MVFHRHDAQRGLSIFYLNSTKNTSDCSSIDQPMVSDNLEAFRRCAITERDNVVTVP